MPVSRVRLIYEGGDLKPKEKKTVDEAAQAAEQPVPGVEVWLQ